MTAAWISTEITPQSPMAPVHSPMIEMGTNANSLARGLQDQGVKKGENIAFLMANCPEYFFCEYALAKIGAVRVPLAVLLSPQDHVYMMNEAECTTLIYHESLSQRVEGMIPGLKTVTRFICVGDKDDPDSGHLLLSDLIDEHPPEPAPVDIDPEDLAGIYFTGGTTGSPQRGHVVTPGLGLYLCHANA